MPLDAMLDYDRKKQGLDAAAASSAQTMAAQPQPTGPTAADVNAQFAQKPSGTFVEFAGRGGLTNTAVDTVNKIKSKLDKKRQLAMYWQVINAGEHGADILYRDAAAEIGPEVDQYVPNRGMSEWGSDKSKVSFYDENGVFLPKKYADAVTLGVLTWRKEQKQKAERQQAGTIISGAQNPQQATAGVLQTGQDVTPYKDAIGTVPTDQDVAATEASRATTANKIASTDATKQKSDIDMRYLPAKYQAEIAKLNAEADDKLKSGAGGGKRTALLVGLEGAAAKYLDQLAQAYKYRVDPQVSQDPDLVAEADKNIARIEKAYDSTRKKIEAENKAVYPGVSLEDTQPAEDTMEKAKAAAETIRSGMKSMPPKGMIPGENEVGSGTLSANRFGPWNGKPSTESYNAELANRVKMWADDEKMTWVTPEIINTLMQKYSLEDALDGILQLNATRQQ
jgi:hypothetical protein